MLCRFISGLSSCSPVSFLYIIVGLAIVGMGFDLMIEEVLHSIRNVFKKVGLVKSVDRDGDGVDDDDEPKERLKRAACGVGRLGGGAKLR